MAHNSAAVVRTKTLTFNAQPHDDWGTPAALDYFGESGKLVRSVLRGPAVSTVTEVTLLVWRGTYADPDNVQDEDKVFERTGVAVVGSATDADDDYNIELNVGGAFYDIQGLVRAAAGAARSVDAPSMLWAAIKGTAGSAADDGVVWSLTAADVV